MELNINYEKEDWKDFQSFLEKYLCKEAKAWYDSFWFNMAVWFVIAFVFFTFFKSGVEFSWATAGIVSFFFVFIYMKMILVAKKYKKAFEPLSGGVFIGKHDFVFGDDGFSSKGNGYNGFHNWGLIKKIENTEKAIYLFIDSAYAFIFPKSKLNDPDEFHRFVLSKVKNIPRQA